ncbi:uncharacterized protein LOC108148443 [Drosophila elegans]|uniref:uncharacterized protein LOC108148443 n=1 Tax=Drosophila elegans TaxID=30023 RepID=UPI0007E68255|nr:uncharacterized protein LOC108148443 [Drosophila elegans]
MVSTKLLLFTALLTIMATGGSAQGFQDLFLQATNTALQSFENFVGFVKTEFYSLVPTKEGYHFKLEEPNGSKREEIGMFLYPGTDKQELVVMGSYSSYDEKTDTDSVTMYTADRNGNKARYEVKNRRLSALACKSACG